MTMSNVVVGLGEVLWDVFPDGPRFGGAPANFSCSVAGLGRDRLEVAIVSAVGQDELGERAIAALVDVKIDVTAVARKNQPTGRVDVQLDEHGHASYQFQSDCAWDRMEWTRELDQLARRADVVCFGTLGQRSQQSMETVRKFVAATRPTALRIFDINLRPPFFSDAIILDSLKLANVLKLNDEELPVLEKLLGLSGTPIEMLRQLKDRFSFQVVALTRGANGAILIRGEDISDVPGVAAKVVDTVGAGDAFTAALAIGLLDGMDLDTINRTACEVAAYVCSQSGATPKIPDRFANAKVST